MKLINKTTLYYFLFLLPVMVLSGMMFYFLLIQQIDKSIDESLMEQQKILTDKFFASDSLLIQLQNDPDNDVTILETKKKIPNTIELTDKFIYDTTEAEVVPFRQLQSTFLKGGKQFQLTVIRSNIERDELVESIALGLAILFCFLLLTFLLVNRFLSRQLWKPFNETLKILNTISFSNMQVNSFKASSIKEFQQLNVALNGLTEKLYNDFNNQKQFTENASHELQTPLAVIKSRIDLLIQSKDVTEEMMEQIQEIEKSVNKLSHLNKSLLLLSKIENHQFDDLQLIRLSELSDKLIAEFDESLKNKNIQLRKEYRFPPQLQLNPLLAEILFSNLFKNAIRHNIIEGEIKIEITQKYFLISNSGTSLSGNEKNLFKRFAKFNTSIESIGLGLAIAKQICEYFNFSITYSSENNLHCFKIEFKK